MCIGQWSEEYSRIIHRFRNIISAQFFGHTHNDEFEIFFGDNEVGERVPINMAYLAPSQTVIDSVNPAYRIYLIDGWSLYSYDFNFLYYYVYIWGYLK